MRSIRLSYLCRGRPLAGRRVVHSNRILPVSSTAKASLTALSVIALCGVGTGAAVWRAGRSARRNISESDLPLYYDADVLETFWMKHKAVVACRMYDIVASTVPVMAPLLWSKLLRLVWEPDDWDSVAEERKMGVALRELLTKLGPSFVKLGQVFSIRPDLLPAPVLMELQRLCDAVPPYPTHEAVSLIERELGRPVGEIFRGLNADSVPVAGASLGQVYKCSMLRQRVNSEKGEEWVEVAVKVQRPDMLVSVSLDLFIMRQVMKAIEWVKSALYSCDILKARKHFNISMLDTFAEASYFELDYEHEAANQKFFAEQFRVRGMDRKVHVPEVFSSATSRRVLTTEWVDGVQLARSSPEVIARLVPVGVECFLAQLLDIGVFHGDPHPGNLLVNTKGQLVLIDFGLCAEVSDVSTMAITTAIVHLMSGDVPALLEDAVTLGFLPEDVDKTSLLPAMQRVFKDGTLTQVDTMRFGSSARRFRTAQRVHKFKQISDQLNQIFFEYPFVVPAYFALITRALIMLEGIAVTGDEDFDIFTASYPYASKRALSLIGKNELSKFGLGGSNLRH